nr:aminoglycoside phosphotransferase family protein [Frigidibacter sp. ROC022]
MRGLRQVAETRTSLILRASAASGDVALKLLTNDDADEQRGGDLMLHYDGIGAARVRGQGEGILLLDWLDGPSLGDLAREGRDGQATQLLAGVAAQLHRPRDHPAPDLPPLEHWLQPLLQTRPASWPQASQPDIAAAADLARQLLDSAPPPVPLHGDLHHDNILSDGETWRAIDPKGILGDSAFDLANAFRNPEGLERLSREPARIDGMARCFADRLALEIPRLLGWASVQAALSASWNRDSGRDPGDDLLLLPCLLDAWRRNARG